MTRALLKRCNLELLSVLDSCNEEMPHHDGDAFHELLVDLGAELAKPAPQIPIRLARCERRARMTTPHPHAEFLHALADGREDGFECHHESWGADVWRRSPGYAGGICQYPDSWTVRHKPRTIRIGNMDVPEPMREAPLEGTRYWIVSTKNSIAIPLTWESDSEDFDWLKSGMCHLKRESAELHRKALILVSGGTP